MEEKSFEIIIDDQKRLVKLGQSICFLYRQEAYRHMDNFLFWDDSGKTRVWKHHELTDWMAGYEIVEDENGVLWRRPTGMRDLADSESEYQTFRQMYGWNPSVIEREAPSEKDRDEYAEMESEDLDEEWSNYGNG